MALSYMRENAFRFLRESGLAEQIIGSKDSINQKDGLRIRYRSIPANAGSSRHHSPVGGRRPQYYRFVSDHIRTIISLFDESADYSITMTSKHLCMDCRAVDMFAKGWHTLEETL